MQLLQDDEQENEVTMLHIQHVNLKQLDVRRNFVVAAVAVSVAVAVAVVVAVAVAVVVVFVEVVVLLSAFSQEETSLLPRVHQQMGLLRETAAEEESCSIQDVMLEKLQG